MVKFGDVFGEFMRETILHIACLRFEVARLKGWPKGEALDHSVSFIGSFESVLEMIEAEGVSRKAFVRDVREAVKEVVEGETRA